MTLKTENIVLENRWHAWKAISLMYYFLSVFLAIAAANLCLLLRLGLLWTCSLYWKYLVSGSIRAISIYLILGAFLGQHCVHASVGGKCRQIFWKSSWIRTWLVLRVAVLAFHSSLSSQTRFLESSCCSLWKNGACQHTHPQQPPGFGSGTFPPIFIIFFLFLTLECLLLSCTL